jgi:hypothetical protein
MNFQIETELTEYGISLIEFHASFNYGTGDWDADDAALIHHSLDDEPLEFDELNKTAQAEVIAHVREALINARPTDEEIDNEREIIRGEHDADCDRDEW